VCRYIEAAHPRFGIKGQMPEILVVDDEGFIRRTIGHVLRRAGHTVREAASGSEGLALFQEKRPHLVITDIIMPEPDGNALIAAMHAAAPDVAIIAISGAADKDGFIRDATERGASLALIKPFPLNDLISHVEALLPPRRK